MPLFTLRSLLFLLLGILTFQTGGARAGSAGSPARRTLEFVENKGQWDARARYVAELPAGRLFLNATGFTYAFIEPQALAHGATTDPVRARAGQAAPEPAPELRAHAYTVTFEGGNPAPVLTGAEATAENRNYFLGSDVRTWASGVQGFRTVRYAEIYSGIGVQLYENEQQQLEYDFTVQPGARPAAIRLRYQGADQLTLRGGRLLIRTSVGTVQELAPQAWQTIRGQRVAVACAFELHANTVTFRLGRYDAQYPLVIDPTVVFSSFTGSTADNWGFTATYDAQGNMYSGGIVFALGYPTSPGAYATTFRGNVDIGIIKFNTAANGAAARLYATYLGGNQADVPHSLVVNPQGELLIMGSTGSSNFPVTSGAYDQSFNGGPAVQPIPSTNPFSTLNFPNGADLFVTRLSANGTALTGSTFLGGTGTDGLLFQGAVGATLVQNYGDQFRGDITTDADGNVYLASSSNSPDFPTPNGFRASFGGGSSDAVVCKFSPDLRQLLWSTFLGGTGADGAFSLQVDNGRNVFVCGGTTSANFPTTSGALQRTYQGSTDGFVAHIGSAGNVLQQATYIGTPAYDQAYFVQLDAENDVYLLGQSRGSFPVTAGMYSVAGGRQFVQKLDNTLSRSLYSTTFGSGRTTIDLALTAFLVDDCERVYISGWGGVTNSGYAGGSTNNLPVTGNALQRTTDGSDFYLAQFTPGMQALEYATFFGQQGGSGEHVDGGTSRFDKRGVVYQAVCGGCGGSSAFPVPPGANTYTTRNNAANCNNAAFKIDFGALVADPGPSQYVCMGAPPIRLGGTPAGGTWSGPGVTATADGTGYEFTPAVTILGRNTLVYKVSVAGTCFSTKTLRMTVTPVINPTMAALPAVCRTAQPVALTATPAGGVFSGPGVTGSTFNPAQAGVGTHQIRYSLPDTVACGDIAQTIVVSAPPVVQAGADTTLCADQTRTFRLRQATPAGGVWSGTSVTPEGLFTPPATNNRGGIFDLRYTVTQNGCAVTATRRVVLAPTSGSNVPLALPECPSAPRYAGLAPFNCQFAPLLPGGTYEWNFGDQTTSTEASPAHVYTRPGTYMVTLTARYANCQVETQFAPVEVGEVFIPNIITPNGDAKNEEFVPVFSCQPASLRVFSRWGNKVFETDTYQNDWRGGNLPDGVYYYQLRDTEGRTAKGWVEVKR